MPQQQVAVLLACLLAPPPRRSRVPVPLEVPGPRHSQVDERHAHVLDAVQKLCVRVPPGLPQRVCVVRPIGAARRPMPPSTWALPASRAASSAALFARRPVSTATSAMTSVAPMLMPAAQMAASPWSYGRIVPAPPRKPVRTPAQGLGDLQLPAHSCISDTVAAAHSLRWHERRACPFATGDFPLRHLPRRRRHRRNGSTAKALHMPAAAH